MYAPGLPANERQRYQLPLPNGSRGGRKGEKRASKKVQTAGGGGAVVRGRFAPVLLWNEKKNAGNKSLTCALSLSLFQ